MILTSVLCIFHYITVSLVAGVKVITTLGVLSILLNISTAANKYKLKKWFTSS